jgi:hypothetical protein
LGGDFGLILIKINNQKQMHGIVIGCILKTLEILKSAMVNFTLLEAMMNISSVWMLKSGASNDYNFYLSNDFKV